MSEPGLSNGRREQQSDKGGPLVFIIINALQVVVKPVQATALDTHWAMTERVRFTTLVLCKVGTLSL